MELNDYQKQAITTKIYDDSVAIPYIVLGLSGEAGELYEKALEYIQDLCEADLFKKEFGDVAWYLAGWAEENDLLLEDIAELATIEDAGSYDLEELLAHVVIYSSQISEFTKKALRDDFEEIKKGQFPQEKLDKANVSAANLLKAIKNLAYYFCFDFDEIIKDNIKKLASRAKRNKIQGSGDDR